MLRASLKVNTANTKRLNCDSKFKSQNKQFATIAVAKFYAKDATLQFSLIASACTTEIKKIPSWIRHNAYHSDCLIAICTFGPSNG